jgi:hypothetical protein
VVPSANTPMETDNPNIVERFITSLPRKTGLAHGCAAGARILTNAATINPYG